MDSVHKIEYKIRDLSTRSVTLFPTRAEICRDIKDVTLKPGINEISIVGITPTVDENSIKVEGTGAAIITDIDIQSLPNREFFAEIYPDSDDDKSDSGSDEEEEKEEKELPMTEEIDKEQEKLDALQDELKCAQEVVANAEKRLKYLDDFTSTLNSRNEGTDIAEGLETYKKEREKTFDDHMKGKGTIKELSTAIAEARTKISKLVKENAKHHEKQEKAKKRANREKVKERLNKARREEERLNEKDRVRKEREKFWPKFVYSIRISLDVGSNFTPSSSRRTSISSETELARSPTLGPTATSEGPLQCDLKLSYITTSAYWSPSYDLQLSTTDSRGILCFDAKLQNSTSESWENCKVTLSTSAATFSGLDEAVPVLQPWPIKLGGKHMSNNDDYILKSRQEGQTRNGKTHNGIHNNANQWQRPRGEMFGIPGGATGKKALDEYQDALFLLEQQNKTRLRQARAEHGGAPDFFGGNQQPVVYAQQQASQGAGLFGGSTKTSQQQQQQQQQQSAPIQQPMMASAVGFGYSTNPYAVPPPPPAQPSSYRGARPHAVAPTGAGFALDSDKNDLAYLVDGEEEETQPTLDFQESLIEETGLTTAYDLPGNKSLIPKSTASKQRIARISFTNVFFSHTIVPKLRAAAHLRAKMRNGSKLTLLRGPVGLTLDGSFMGRSTLPHCNAGDYFNIGLGVDPAIRVQYPQPSVRRATTGVFTKEGNSAYSRSVTIENTRASSSKPVDLLVLDQVPVSEDERLRVDLLQPSGVSIGGAAVSCGGPAREIDGRGWGKAKVLLKKGGEVRWEVALQPGKACKLGLEYLVATPAGEFAVQA